METGEDLEVLTRVIRGRRTVKPDLLDPDRPVPAGLLDQLLENATWAPNHGRTEPWWFVVFEGSARKELVEALQAIYRETTLAAEFRPDKFAKLGINPLKAPCVIAVGLRRGENPKIPEVEETEAVACAVQNLLLSASAAGLGGFWSSPAICYDEATREFLGLRPGDRCLGLIYLGWPREGVEGPVRLGGQRPSGSAGGHGTVRAGR